MTLTSPLYHAGYNPRTSSAGDDDEVQQHYRVLAPEWPGFGESTGEERIEDMLDFALHGWDLVDALGVERPHLVGHLMGGMIAAEMAVRGFLG